MGVPEELVTLLQKKYNIRQFIETGTFYGGTAVWASEFFETVFTIEFSSELYEKISTKYQDIKNIQFLFGDSRVQLNRLINKLDKRAIFWLDAHWSGGETYGEEDQCPLIEEINIINCSSIDHFILIDDARLFTSPPQPPHHLENWPSISQVIDTLRSKFSDKYIVIIEDVIIAVPSEAKLTLAKYCQQVNAKAWEDYGKNLRESKLEKGIKLILSELKSLISR